MTEEQALAAVTAAIAKARSMGVRVTAVAVDAGGHLKALVRMDGAPFHGVTISTDKARTAAGFGKPTAQWKDRIGTRPHVLEGLSGRDGFIPIGGGVPVLRDGDVTGAIGISGATEDEDCEIAAAGLAILA
ncbi:GlcG/HbpS family heme-binding protein [Paramagnetospirillum magneticum]|uniref:GlcG protein n=1 Tax=Paramagnetospirillum magneticum (strain ATCC 700264 / AMB-1) TaxID=342108 RepID=Q2W958_PARM1|nr:heme-binding protein [Paramagnetospirillum magneticum]BAE49617.1 Uncharacterized protein amb0813 [Paramagnetospirillum magneticum AMB-1]